MLNHAAYRCDRTDGRAVEGCDYGSEGVREVVEYRDALKVPRNPDMDQLDDAKA